MSVDKYLHGTLSLLLDIRNNTRPEGVAAISMVDLFPEDGPGVIAANKHTRKPRTAAEPAGVVEATAPVAAEPDPFNTTPPAPVVVVTIAQVRDAAVVLSRATSQDSAVAVLKAATGAGSLVELTPDKYGTALQALQAATPKAPSVEADPFATGAVTSAPVASAAVTEQSDVPTAKDLRDAVVAAQKRTGDDPIVKIIREHDGVLVVNGVPTPSIKTVPDSKRAACIAAVKALPKTK